MLAELRPKAEQAVPGQKGRVGQKLLRQNMEFSWVYDGSIWFFRDGYWDNIGILMEIPSGNIDEHRKP